MSYIFESFKDWQKKVNEDNASDKLKIRNEIDQKMIIKVINNRTFRVKAKWGGDVIDAVGNLTQDGWNRIMQEINNTIPEGGRFPLIQNLQPLQDLTTNIVRYEVVKDTDSAKDPNPNIKKQSFEFTVLPRPKGVPTDIQYYLRGDEASLGSVASSQSQSTDVKTGEVLSGPKKSVETFGLNFSKGAIPLTNLTDPKLIKLIDSFYFKVLEDGSLSGNPQVKATLKGIKGELVANALGDNSKILISALNAGFSITTRYGDPETGITQTLVNNMANAKSKENEGTPLSEIDGFNTGAFLANLKPISNIAVPAGGFIKGKVVKDEEFKKFQQLLITKFQKSLGSSQIYKNFAKFKVGGADGTYGNNTANLVGLLKSALSDPKWTGNMDKNNVDQAFVDRINQEKVAESYIGLDGFTLVVEGIDMTAVQSYEGSASKGTRSSAVVSQEDSSVNKGKKYLLQGKDGYEYFVKDNVWHYKKDGGKLMLVLNASSIKELIKTYPSANGYYILTYAKTVGSLERANKHIYKLQGGAWYVQLFGMQAWQKVKEGADLDRLNALYSGKDSGKSTVSEKVDLTKLDSDFIKLGTGIKKFIEGGSFDAYKGTINDDEESAWNEVLYPQWKSVWKKEVSRLYTQANKVTDENAKSRYFKTIGAIKKMFTEHVGDSYVSGYSFHDKFHKGSLVNDTFELKLYLGATTVVKLIKIDLDF
jgi:hypothetical protein